METKALDGQSLADIAVQETGTLEGIFPLAVANNRSITDALEPGTGLATTTPRDSQVYNYYRVRGLTPATELTETAEEGIEFWAVERDFAVS